MTSDEDQSANATNDDCHPRVNDGAIRCDADETGKRAIETHRDVVVSDHRLHDEGDSDGATGGGERGSDGSLASNISSTCGDHEGRAAVEAVPAKPQDEGAQGLEDLVALVELHNLTVHKATRTGPEDDGAHHAGESTDHVNNAGASEVDHAVRLLRVQGEKRAGRCSPG